MKIRAAIVGVLMAAWILYFAGAGLHAWFTDDDLMNLYFASGRSVGQFLAGFERPVANLFLKALWSMFGFQPAPYRLVCFALIMGNVALAAALMLRISGSGAVGLFGSILLSFHSELTDLYFSTGTIYDLLCFAFYFGALLWYAVIRQAGRTPSWLEELGLCAMALLAMGSKEMAVTLPVMLVVTEWTCGNRRHWRTTLYCGAVCAVMLAAIIGRSAMSGNEAYRPVFTVDVYEARWRNYLMKLNYTNDAWTVAHGRIFLLACVVLAAVVRRKEAWWATLLIFVSSLPVLFVPQRNLYALYIPFLGFCLLAAAALTRLVRALGPRGNVFPAIAAALLALLLWPEHQRMSQWSHRWYYEMEQRLKGPGEAIHRGWPGLPPGSKVHFAEDPFDADTWTLHFLTGLVAGDHSIQVSRDKVPYQRTSESQWSDYAAVFRLTNSELRRVR